MPMRASSQWVLLATLTLSMASLALVSCSDDAMPANNDHAGSEHDAGEGSHDHTLCGMIANCMNTVTLADGLNVKSAKSKFTVEVVSHDPLVIQGNRWVLKITDATGAVVKDAELTQDVFSVDCMHGGPLPPQEITPNADGQYEVKPFHEHEGPWDTELKISAGGVTDTATIHLCIPEADGDAG